MKPGTPSQKKGFLFGFTRLDSARNPYEYPLRIRENKKKIKRPDSFKKSIAIRPKRCYF